jgi:Putative transcriptional regulator
MAQPGFLKNQFLVAMPALVEGQFDHAVTLVCEHGSEGAMGLVVNRPTELKLADMLRHLDLPHESIAQDVNVFWGGPVSTERGFVVHGPPGGWESCLELQPDLFVTTSRDVLASIGRGEGPEHYLVVLGYAGWAEGQLDSEMLDNAWLNTPVSQAILFQMPPRQRWPEAARLIGVDVASLASGAGHA